MISRLGPRAYTIFLLTFLTGVLLGTKFPNFENGDFETGDLSGWTVFTTPNGTVGGKSFPQIAVFDTNGDGTATKSLRLKVGQQKFNPDGAQLAGGGIWKDVFLNEGKVVLRADIATVYFSPSDRRNLAGGFFEILLDGQVLADYEMGPIENGQTKRFTLSGGAFVAKGPHEIRVQVRRPFRSRPNDHAPLQFIDNIQALYLRP